MRGTVSIDVFTTDGEVNEARRHRGECEVMRTIPHLLTSKIIRAQVQMPQTLDGTQPSWNPSCQRVCTTVNLGRWVDRRCVLSLH